VVIKVGKTQITEKDFETRINDIEPEGGDPDSPGGPSEKNRRAMGDDYASVLMLSQQAISDHLDASPEIRRQLEVARLQILSDAEFAKLKRQAEPTSEEVAKFYSTHASDYDQVQIRRLFIWKHNDESSGGPSLSSQDARARAEKVRQLCAAGTDPKKVAEELKETNEGLFDADALTFPRGELKPQMEKIAFGLKDGEWSEVEDTPASLLWVQLVKRSRRPLTEVSSAVQDRLQNEKLQAKLDDLKKKTGIWLDPKYFAARTDSDSLPAPKIRKSAATQENKNEQ
jgi:parvulin-like peptidyl-prolyl isomerase